MAKNPFRAYLSDAAKKQLEVIRQHEQDKIGPGPDGEPVKLNDTWVAENLISRYHEPIASGVTNRQKLGGMSDELSALRADVVELKQVINVRLELNDAFRQAIADDIVRIVRTLDRLMEERNHVHPTND